MTEQKEDLFRVFFVPYISPSDLDMISEHEDKEEALAKAETVKEDRWKKGIVVVHTPEGVILPVGVKYVVDGVALPEIFPNQKLPILSYPHHYKGISKKVTKRVASTETMKEFVAKMLFTMYTAPGIGLAATQVGIHDRLIVVDGAWAKTGEISPTVLFNPVLVDPSEETQNELEGCLSVPGMWHANVKRSIEVLVKGKKLNWEDATYSVYGQEAAIFQHEVDHLDGKVFLDRISRLKRDMYKRKLTSIQRKAKKQAMNLIRQAQDYDKDLKRVAPWVKV